MKKSITILGVLCALAVALVFTGCPNNSGGGEGIVTFDSKGASAIAPITGVTAGTKLTRPTDPSKDSAVFQGWYKESEYTTEWDFTVDTVKDSCTLYAKWLETFKTNENGNTITGFNTGVIVPQNLVVPASLNGTDITRISGFAKE